MTIALLTIAGAGLLAFANGANDVSKGVATLAGTGRATYRTAIAWGTFWTFAGAIASLLISVGLVHAFTTAIVEPDVLGVSVFPLAAAVGAAAAVMLASATGLPVSTTHALAGAIVGVALVAGGAGAVRWSMLLWGIAAPLALSPVVSAVVGYGMHGVAERVQPACVCVRDAIHPAWADGGDAVAGVLAPQVVVSAAGCAEAEDVRRFMPSGLLHWGAAAALSFARGVNDNAKIAAIAVLGFPALGLQLWMAFAVTAIAMTLGSYVAGLRVTRTLGEGVVQMDQDTGLAAALVAAGLVMAASFYTLPVSTTHVATGAIVGAGVHQGNGAVLWPSVGSLASAWVGTVPAAAALAAAAAWLLMAFA